MCIGGGGAERQEAGQYEAQMAQMAQQEVNYWKKGGFRELENAAILDTKKQGSDNKMQQARGKSHVAAIRGMQMPTVVNNPNSGTSKTAMAGMGIAAADALARTSNDADLMQRTKDKAGQTELARFGRGQQGIANSSLQQSAGMELSNNTLNMDLKRSASDFNSELAGSIAGMAVGGMGGGAKEGGTGKLGEWDSATNTITGDDGLSIDMGKASSAWDTGMAKVRTMFG